MFAPTSRNHSSDHAFVTGVRTKGRFDRCELMGVGPRLGPVAFRSPQCRAGTQTTEMSLGVSGFRSTLQPRAPCSVVSTHVSGCFLLRQASELPSRWLTGAFGSLFFHVTRHRKRKAVSQTSERSNQTSGPLHEWVVFPVLTCCNPSLAPPAATGRPHVKA